MADARIVTLLKALKSELENQLDCEIHRRYVPYLSDKSVQLEDERISVFPSADEEELASKLYDQETLEVGIEVAQSLPESGEQSITKPDAAINQLEFLDARMLTVDNIKNLFRDDGELREEKIGGCYFAGLQHKPIYSVEALVQHGLFASILRISFTYSG